MHFETKGTRLGYSISCSRSRRVRRRVNLAARVRPSRPRWSHGFAAPIPLRGVARRVLLGAVIDQLDGPVVLVGHSYGGAVITVAGSSDKVAGLVYVAGVVPDEGESITDLQARYPSLVMGPLLQPRRVARWGCRGVGRPSRASTESSAPTCPTPTRSSWRIAQRPLLATAFEEPAVAAAWRVKPSWARVRHRRPAGRAQLHRFSYERAGSKVTEVEGASHFLMLSQPDIVAGVIREAVQACAANLVA